MNINTNIITKNGGSNLVVQCDGLFDLIGDVQSGLIDSETLTNWIDSQWLAVPGFTASEVLEMALAFDMEVEVTTEQPRAMMLFNV